MRLTSIRPGSCTSCDLGSGHWRLLISAVPGAKDASPALALALRIPPAVPFALRPDGVPLAFASYHQLALASAPIELAQRHEDIEPVAAVCLAGGTRDADTARTTEAMSLFRNLPRVRAEVFDACLRDACALVAGYWQVVEWLSADSRTRQTINLLDAKVILEP